MNWIFIALLVLGLIIALIVAFVKDAKQKVPNIGICILENTYEFNSRN